eukprot:1465827-Rhodomonas_salina.1
MDVTFVALRSVEMEPSTTTSRTLRNATMAIWMQEMGATPIAPSRFAATGSSTTTQLRNVTTEIVSLEMAVDLTAFPNSVVMVKPTTSMKSATTATLLLAMAAIYASGRSAATGSSTTTTPRSATTGTACR